MDKSTFFQSVIGFIAHVHSSTHTLMKNSRSNAVTPQQHSILEYIFFCKTATPSQVADCLNISLPNASRELKKLSILGLITKQTDTKDRRKTTISLSESGQNLMAQTFRHIEENFRKDSETLSEEEMESIVASMKFLEEKIFYQSDPSATER